MIDRFMDLTPKPCRREDTVPRTIEKRKVSILGLSEPLELKNGIFSELKVYPLPLLCVLPVLRSLTEGS
jgi:hypothetical protein